MKKESMLFRDAPTDDDLTAPDVETGVSRAGTRQRAQMQRITGDQVASNSAATKEMLRRANESAASNGNGTQSTKPSTTVTEKQPTVSPSPDEVSTVHPLVPPQPGPSSTVNPPVVTPQPGSSSISQSSVVVRPIAVNPAGFTQYGTSFSGHLLSGNVDPATDPMVLMANAVLPHPGWTSHYGQQDQFITAGGTLFLPRWTTECPVWSHPIFFQRMSSRDIVGSMTELGILLVEKND
jgi:hypothetical protein